MPNNKLPSSWGKQRGVPESWGNKDSSTQDDSPSNKQSLGNTENEQEHLSENNNVKTSDDAPALQYSKASETHTIEIATEKTKSPKESQSTAKSSKTVVIVIALIAIIALGVVGYFYFSGKNANDNNEISEPSTEVTVPESTTEPSTEPSTEPIKEPTMVLNNYDVYMPILQEHIELVDSYESKAWETVLPEIIVADENPTPTPVHTPDVFSVSEIPEDIQTLMWGKTIRESSLVQFQDLCYLTITHWGFDGQKHEGNLIVNKQISEDVLEIFTVLLENNFPIEKMILPDYYDGNDEMSMRDNNTSAFNDRPIEGSGALSWHQLGLAIDINPLYNPYIHFASSNLQPETASEYLDRTLGLQGMIFEDDICVSVFKEHGFTWGGDWTTVKDYQHFEKAIN